MCTDSCASTRGLRIFATERKALNRDHPKTVLLLVSTCCHVPLVRPFLHVANVLSAAGVKVVVLLTDGDCCSFFSKLKPPTAERCAEQRGSTLEILRGVGLHVINLATLLPDAMAGVTSLLQLPAEDAPSIPVAQYLSHPLWNIIRATVTRHCDWDRLPEDTGLIRTKDAAAIRGFLAAAARYQHIFQTIFDEYCPSHIMVFNGVFYEERIASDIAASHGIQVVVNESSCFTDRWIYRHVAPSVGIRASQRLQVPSDCLAISPEAKIQLDSYLDGVYTGQNNRIYQPGPGVASDTLQRLSACSQRIALFLGQVPYDTVITEDTMVTSVEDVVLEAIQAFEGQSDWHLVIRLHPGARQTATHQDRLAEILEQHPSAGNFTLVKAYEVSTYDLMQLAEMGITISSQAGLEVLGQHKPVVVLGDAFYRGNGVTIDRQVDESVPSAIERGRRFVPTDEWKDRVDAVLSYWIFQHLTAINGDDGSLPPESAQRILQLFGASE